MGVAQASPASGPLIDSGSAAGAFCESAGTGWLALSLQSGQMCPLQRVVICPPNRRSLEPRFKIENRRVHRFGRPCWVKIFPKVCDLIASGTQEHDVLLAVNAAGGLDQSFGLDLRHGALWVCKRIDLWIDEAEVFDRPQEPSNVMKHLS